MKYGLGRTTPDVVCSCCVGAAVLAGIAFSIFFFPEMAVIYLILGLFAVPEITITAHKRLVPDIILALAAAVFTVYTDHIITSYGHEFFEGSNSLFAYLFSHSPVRFMVEVVLVLLIYLILRTVRVGSKLTAALIPVPMLLLSLTDYYVYNFRGSEFIPGDMYAVTTALSVITNYKFDLLIPTFFVALPYFLYAVAIRRLKFETPEVSRTKRTRIILAAASLVCAAGFAIWLSYLGSHRDVLVWHDEAAEQNGFITNYVLLMRSLKIKKPHGYNKKEMEQLTSMTTFDSSGTSNIIVIMNESYTDMDIYRDVLGDFEEPAPFWKSLTENTVKGYSYVSVYGGRTPNSEFEFLTSLPVAYLPGGSIPYSMYIDSDTYSLPNYLRGSGYSTLAMHPYFSSGWSRETAYPYLGFDDALYIDDFDYDDEDLIRGYVSDMCAYDNLLAELEKQESPSFTFLVTMQNHGGYDLEYDNFTVHQYIEGDDERTFEINNYMSLVNESDKALEHLISELSQKDEKYTVLIFGDHQPMLDIEASYDLGGEKWEVPYLIWTNYDMPAKLTECEDTTTSLNFLALDVLSAAGIEYSPYYERISEFREIMPLSTFSGYYGTDEIWHGYDDISAAGDAIDRYFSVRYYSLFDN